MITETIIEAGQEPGDALQVEALETDQPNGWEDQRAALMATMEREGYRSVVAIRVRRTVEVIERVLFERAEVKP